MHGRNVEGKGLALILTSITYFETGTPCTKQRALHAVPRSLARRAGFNLMFKGMEELVRG
jgi:hypothetical protein